MIHPISSTKESYDVPEMAVTKGRPVDSGSLSVEMFISADVDPLVGCHGEVSDLVQLAGDEDDGPGECKELDGCEDED